MNNDDTRPHDPYAAIPELYDLEHAGYHDDVEFLLELARLGDGPILELGCGSGRILFPLAEDGHHVVGVDASAAMLDRANAEAERLGLGANITLVEGDMSDATSAAHGPYGLVIVALNSLMHLTDAPQQKSMLINIHATLKSGGRVIIDTLNPTLEQLTHLLDTTHHEGSWRLEDGSTIDKWGHRKADSESQVIDTLIWYDQLLPDHSVRRTRTSFGLRYVHQSELALLLEIAGFNLVDWYGSYDLDPWYPDSERIIAIAHKA